MEIVNYGGGGTERTAPSYMVESQDWGGRREDKVRREQRRWVGQRWSSLYVSSQMSKSLLCWSGGDVVGVKSSVQAAVSQTSRCETGQTGGRYNGPVVTRSRPGWLPRHRLGRKWTDIGTDISDRCFWGGEMTMGSFSLVKLRKTLLDLACTFECIMSPKTGKRGAWNGSGFSAGINRAGRI